MNADAVERLDDDQVVLITGGGGAIGMGLARACADRGWRVALADINPQALDANLAMLDAVSGRSLAVPMDVRDPAAWERVVDHVEARLGPVSLLFNNAGVVSAKAAAAGGGIDRLTFDEWKWTFAVNVDGAFLGMKTLIPRMKRRESRSHIINMSSMMGVLPVRSNGLMSIAYPAAKAAVAMMTAQMRTELAEQDCRRIGLSVVYPGAVRSTISASSLKLAPGGDACASVPAPAPAANPAKTSIRLGKGMDPLLVGKFIVDAVDKGLFHIVTHPEYRPAFLRYTEEIRQAFGASAEPGFDDWTAESIDLEWAP